MDHHSTTWTHLVCWCWRLFVSSCSWWLAQGLPGQCGVWVTACPTWALGWLLMGFCVCSQPSLVCACCSFSLSDGWVVSADIPLQKIILGRELSVQLTRQNGLPKNVGSAINGKLSLIVSSEKERSLFSVKFQIKLKQRILCNKIVATLGKLSEGIFVVWLQCPPAGVTACAVVTPGVPSLAWQPGALKIKIQCS